MESLRRTVLVLSDDDEFVDLIEELVSVDELFHVHNEQGRLPPDIVVVDISDPDLDGLSVLGQVHHAFPEAAVIAVAPVPDPITLVAALDRGANTCIATAHLWRELLPVARQHLSQSAAAGSGAVEQAIVLS